MPRSWNLQCQLLVAIQTNDEECVRRLVEDSAVDLDCTFNVGGQKKPAVCLCVQRGNLQLLRYLVERGCSVNQSDSLGHSPLHIACAHSYEAMVGLLLSNRANVNAITPQGHTPLHLASKTDSLDIVRILCENGAEVDRADNERKTPLLNACIQGHLGVASYLLSRGANVNACSPCGNTPLLFAASAHHTNLQLLAILLDAGATLNHQNAHGESALHAVLRGTHTQRVEAMSLLISHGCQLNLYTNLGHTPLHLSALQHDKEALLCLLRAGCEVSVKDKLGLTPLFYSLREGDEEMVEVLVAAGARINEEQWLNDTKLLASVKKPALIQWIVSSGKRCPRLIDICRSTLRLHCRGGERTYNSIENLDLPLTLKQFLLFEAV